MKSVKEKDIKMDKEGGKTCYTVNKKRKRQRKLLGKKQKKLKKKNRRKRKINVV